MKYTFALVLAMLFASFSSFAQEESKKVIIIKKVKDENGKIITEKIKADGADADELLEKLKKDGTLEGIDIDIEIEKALKGGKVGQKKIIKSDTEEIRVEKSIIDGKENTTYTITTNEGGNKEVMVWTGEGDMPADMAEKIKKHEMHQLKTKDGQEMIFIGDGADSEIHKEIRIEVENPNKVTLGVMVNDFEGVEIDDIVADSPAENAGLKAGDIILKIDNNYIFNLDMLLSSLKEFDKGDNCTIRYIRDSKEVDVTVKF